MQPNDEAAHPPTTERDEARARLACQIGRLLAHAWFQSQSAVAPTGGSSAVDADSDAAQKDSPAENVPFSSSSNGLVGMRAIQ